MVFQRTISERCSRPGWLNLKLKDTTIGPDPQEIFRKHVLYWEQKVTEFERKSTDVTDLRENIHQKPERPGSFAMKSSRLLVATNEDKPLQEDQRAQIENAIYEFDAMYEVLVRCPCLPSDIDPFRCAGIDLGHCHGTFGQFAAAELYLRNSIRSKEHQLLHHPPAIRDVITAFVIFIVAKAGIPLIAKFDKIGGKRADQSLLHLVPGNHFRHVIGTGTGIAHAYRLNYFREGDAGEPLRWARKTLWKTSGLRAATRTNCDGCSRPKDSEWSEWLQGKEAMPANVQVMVAAVLQKPRRELFTDIPPDLSEPEPTNLKSRTRRWPVKDGAVADPSQATR